MKRKYRNGLEPVFLGIQAAIEQGASLARSAECLLREGDYPLALSVAVLALEELGKALMIDGLLFAKPGDEKVQALERGHRKHTEKLRYVQALPMYLDNQAIADPRSDEPQYKARITAARSSFVAALGLLQREPGAPEVLQDLDMFKQRGFYTELKPGMIVESPAAAISASLAHSVVNLARVASDAASIPFEVGIEPYVRFVGGIRANLTEAQHQHLEAMMDALYGPRDGQGGDVR